MFLIASWNTLCLISDPTKTITVLTLNFHEVIVDSGVPSLSILQRNIELVIQLSNKELNK